MKKKYLIFSLLVILITIFAYPTFYYTNIQSKVYDNARLIVKKMYEFRRLALESKTHVGFVFDHEKGSYFFFLDNNLNNEYDKDTDKIEFSKKLDKNIIAFNLFENIDKLFFYPNATCNLFSSENKKSIYLIHELDKKKNNYKRLIRVQVSPKTCSIKLSKVLKINGNDIFFEK